MRGVLLVCLLAFGCGDDATGVDAGRDVGGSDVGGSDVGGSDVGGADGSPDVGRDTAVDDVGPVDAPVGAGGAVRFVRNATREHDYSLETVLPPTFGEGELTFELWIRPDDSFPVGPAESGEQQLTEWCSIDNRPYSGGDWWYKGNFLLDGHNNGSGFEQGTFSLQFYGGGRLRWLFGDGGFAGEGGHWSVGAFPAADTPSLLDGAWHAVAVVRRHTGASGADLELWIDGTRIATERTTERTNMRDWWNTWAGFPSGQEGWFWGAEKQAAILALDQYEDFKGDLAEIRYWSIARSEADLRDFDARVSGDEAGLVGWFPFDEGSGDRACDALDRSRCMTFFRTGAGLWISEGPPLR